jgi:hypothetical protein
LSDSSLSSSLSLLSALSVRMPEVGFDVGRRKIASGGQSFEKKQKEKQSPVVAGKRNGLQTENVEGHCLERAQQTGKTGRGRGGRGFGTFGTKVTTDHKDEQ